jgi:ubiquinone/menaquinone biosynthesis C-methylase UbiE
LPRYGVITVSGERTRVTVNYDLTDIPAGYDRGRDLAPDMLALWMRALKGHVDTQPVEKILDLGCGTGRFSEALAGHFAADVLGVDPSTKMLERAMNKCRNSRVRYLRGQAEAIPLHSESVDVVFISMSFHHFWNRALAARECRRVLRESGTVFVRTGTRDRAEAYPYVPFFPSSRSIIEALLPDPPTLCAPFEAAGFRVAAREVITQRLAESWEDYADRLAAGGDSVLAQLTPDEMQQGVAAVRKHGARVGEQVIAEPIDLFVFC